LLSNRLNRITPVQECDPDWSGHATEGKQGTKKLAT
jgi:hypothetical protein